VFVCVRVWVGGWWVGARMGPSCTRCHRPAAAWQHGRAAAPHSQPLPPTPAPPPLCATPTSKHLPTAGPPVAGPPAAPCRAGQSRVWQAQITLFPLRTHRVPTAKTLSKHTVLASPTHLPSAWRYSRHCPPLAAAWCSETSARRDQ